MTRPATQRIAGTDGRLLRSERSRELIAGALYELVGDRAALFERVAPYMRATNPSRGRSQALAAMERAVRAPLDELQDER